jgi:hypothetical protein
MMETINGRVVSATSRAAVPNMKIEAWSSDRRRKTPLATATSDARGAFALQFEAARGPVSFRVHRDGQQVLDTSGTTMWTPDRGDAPVVISVPDDRSTNGSGAVASVTGTVATELGVAGANLKVEIWDHSVDGATLVASTTTDQDGRYQLLYDPAALPGKTRADLEVRVLDPARKDALITSSPVMYQAGPEVAFDPVVDAVHVARAPEFTRLHASIDPLLGETPLSHVDVAGVTYLAERSGWDARAVAMAAQAERISADSRIPVEHCYALLRTGAPGSSDNLHRFSDAQVRNALVLAQKSDIIGGEASIDKTVELHRVQAAQQLLEVAPPTAVSTLSDMLDISLAAADRNTFLDVYRNAGDEPDGLWKGLEEAGFGREKIARLRATSALGRLTMQNAPVVGRLIQKERIRGLDDLASNGFHAAERWSDVIGDSVPAGLTPDAYAAGLAAQVRIAAPTLVAADLVRRKQVELDGEGDKVVDFLTGAHGAHTIGEEPMYRWEGFDELDEDGKSGALLVERLWQISPSNESMAALARLKIGSAKKVAGYGREDFLALHGKEFPSDAEARMVHDKATQVHTTALTVATMYLAQRSMPNVYALSGTAGKAAPKVADFALAGTAALKNGAGTTAAATLENLFQNMDYCACEQCNSVFGPAAYMVELLEFLDLTGTPHDKQNPIDVLKGRRPDLEHIQLSCENTNVALPYVDLVNEILEYYIVNGNLTNFTGHDMTAASKTADLLADPQYVQDAAYDETVASVYPWSLPFDRPVAKLRLLFDALDTTLADALSVFGDAAGARREWLGLNGAEYRILTEVGFHALPEYFGQPAAATIDDLNDAVANGKRFCRTVDITYEDLAEILGARFVNPGAGLVPLLEDLKVELASLQDWYEANITDAELDALLPADLDQTAYGGDLHTWLTANRDLIMSLITLTDVSADPVECDFAEVELRYALPDPANNRLDEIAYLRLSRFIRLWRKLGQSVERTDRLVTTFLGLAPEDLTPANIDATFVAMLARLANFEALIAELSVPKRLVPDWLSLWDPALDPGVRSARLAGLLRAGTVDMASVIAITGIDPFANDLEADEPSMLRFARSWREVKASPLKVADLDYLLRHQDATGKLEPSDDELLREVKALRDAMTAVDADLGAAALNPDLNATRAKMALVYDEAVVARLFALIGHTTTYTAPFVTTEETLPAPLIIAEPGIDFDPFAKQLTYAGILPSPSQAALDAAADALLVGDLAPGTTGAQRDAFVAAFKASVQTLRNDGAADLQALASEYPELAAVFTAVDPITDPAAKSAAVLDAILPELRDCLKTLALRTSLAAITKADPLIVDAITSGSDVVHAEGDPSHGVLDDFRGLETPIALDANGTFDLLVDPPATADYILYVAAPENTQVTLSLEGTDVIPATGIGTSEEVATAVPVALTTGGLTRLQLTLANLPAGGAARLRWRTKAIAKIDIPGSGLYTKAATDTARASLIRIEKVTLLQKALGLTRGELRHVAAVESNTKGVLDDLDTDGSIADAALHALWAKVERLIWLTRLKADHESDPDTFLSIFRDPGRTTPQGKLVVAGVMEWDETSLADVLAHDGLAQADLAHFDDFRTVAYVLDLVAATMQPAADVLAWAVANPSGALLTAAQEALRTRMTNAAWRDLMQGVNDSLRNQSRDALVAYILFHHPPDPDVKTPDDLYQHFLVDVQMDACMQTSRIRLALSTVQLFITRCLMNLEPDVSPASIRADRWAWMQRYRVWEANRRVFVFPENWLEPELRDNKSPFFRELESELLKSDITDDAAEEAYLSYLKKLDDVAKLEIVGAFLHQPHPGHPDEDVLHVFGRTNGTTRTHYARRFEYGYWTPWEKMPLNIDGDMVVPVVWKSQLFVFWATTVQKKNDDEGTDTAWDVAEDPWATHAQFAVEVTLNWGEFYRGKWTSPKSSEMTDPLRITGVGTYEPSKLVITAHTEQPGGNLAERLVMPVLYFGHETAAFLVTFTSKHSAPRIDPQTPLEGLLTDPVKVFNWKLFWEGQSAGVLDSNSLRLSDRTMEAGVDQPPLAKTPRKSELVLTKSTSLLKGFRVRPLMHPIDNQWNAPFFYSDEHSLFSVEAREVIWDDTWLDIFYDNGPSVVFTIDEIPPVYEKPVIPNRGDPVINPWETSVDPNFKTIIKDNVAFRFDGAVFDAGGLRVAGIGGGFH